MRQGMGGIGDVGIGGESPLEMHTEGVGVENQPKQGAKGGRKNY